jgi:hypothetical protein
MDEPKSKLALPTFVSAVLVGVAIWAVAGTPVASKRVTLQHVVSRR